MTDTMLFTLGLPHGTWTDAAATMLGDAGCPSPFLERLHSEVFRAPSIAEPLNESGAWSTDDKIDSQELRRFLIRAVEQGQRTGGADARLCRIGTALAGAWTEARFLVWVEQPASAFANWFKAEPEASDISEMLTALHAASQGLNQLVQQYPAQCFVVELGEVVAQPVAFRERLEKWLGKSISTTAAYKAPVHDALVLSIATRAVAAESTLLRAYERLHASCVVLIDTLASPTIVTTEPSELATDAIRIYRDLMRGEQVHRTALAAAQHRGELTLARLHGVQEELEASFLSGERLGKELAIARAELETALVSGKESGKELAAVRVDLETALMSGKQSVKALAAARLELAAARENQTRSEKALADLRAAASLAEASAQKLQATCHAEVEQVRQEIKQESQKSELVLVQLHQVQEELEQYYLAYQSLEGASRRTGGVGGTVHVGRIEPGLSHEMAPHRELTLTLHEVKGADRSYDWIRVRLVEHHGRPGVCLFGGSHTLNPLMAWEPTGTEGSLPFVLLVPDDEPSRLRLQNLGAGDWQFLTDLVLEIAVHLARGKVGAPARWPVVADRLFKGLIDLPTRFRFDRIDVAAHPSASNGVLARFRGATIGGIALSELLVFWVPNQDGENSVELSIPQPVAPGSVFKSWPVDEAGEWLIRWRLPLGRETDIGLSKQWQAMSMHDRERLLALLDAMPAVARRAAEDGLVSGDRAQELVAAAISALRSAHKMIYRSRLRRIWRALRGRLVQ